MGFFASLFRRSTRPERAPMLGVKPVVQRGFSAGEDPYSKIPWFTSGRTPDQNIFAYAERMRTTAQDLEINDDMIRRFLAVMESKVVGPEGYIYQARVRDPKGKLDVMANKILEDLYRKGGKLGQYDVTRRMTRVDGQNMTLRRLLVDGEVIKRYWPGFDNKHRFAVEFIDPARLDLMLNREPGQGQNRITMGVETDAFGAPVAYHFLPPVEGVHGINQVMPAGNHQRIEARYIRHIFIQERPNQRRGFTWLCSGAQRKKLLDAFEKATVIAARLAATKRGFFTSEKGEEYTGIGEDETGATIMSAGPDELFEQLPAGVSLAEWKPEFPPADVAALIKAFKQGISSGLNVSYPTLANDLEGVSFSSLRQGELTDRDFFRKVQAFQIAHDVEPEHEAWLPMVLLSGATRLPAEKAEHFSSAEFWGRSWQWVDPKKEHEAQVIQHRLGRSLHSIHRENGWDFEEEQELRATEPDLATPASVPPSNEPGAQDPADPVGDDHAA